MRISTNQYQQISLRSMLEQQAKLSKVQEQVSTGRRILSPSDDPSGSARALELAKSIETIQGYSKNADVAESRMRVEESVLTQVGDVIQRVRELAVQANNGSQTPEDRQKIGAEVRQSYDELVRLANSTDGNGEYLFAGGKSRTRPFVESGGVVNYTGDQSTRRIQVGPGRTMETTHSGFEVFMKIFNGDGENVSAADPANTGSGVISSVDVANPAATPADEYSIEFRDNAGTLEYQVLDDGGAQSVGWTAFTEDAPIKAGGLQVSVSGTPAAGDTFTFGKSSPQSLFKSVDRFADALENASSGDSGGADYLNVGNRTLQDLDQALGNLLDVRAQLGARMNALDNERNANDGAALELKSTKSEIEDLDYAKAVTQLNQRLTGLRAAQQSYVKIQGLSLFNYL